MSQQTLDIQVAGKAYKISCPKGKESALLAAAAELDERISSVSKNAIGSNEQNLLMVALNLANDLLLSQQENTRYQQETESKIQLLQSTIEQALKEQQ